MISTDGTLFLVNHVVTRPDEVPDVVWDDALARERATAVERVASGMIESIWRVPDTLANWAVWNVESERALDAILHSLPLARWSVFAVHPVIEHPLMQGQSFEEQV